MRYSRLPPNRTGGPESDCGPRRPNGSAPIWNQEFHHAPQATAKRGACGRRHGRLVGSETATLIRRGTLMAVAVPSWGVSRTAHGRRGYPMDDFFSGGQRLDQVAQSVEIDQAAEAVEALVKAVIADRLAGHVAGAGECVLEPAKVQACTIDCQGKIVQCLNLHR